MTRVAIIGPGAIGGTIAIWLANAGVDVTLCSRTGLGELHLITPYDEYRAAPHILLPGEDGRGAVDFVFVTTKTYDAAGAAAWFPVLVDNMTRVAILQNGVEHVERFSDFLPEDQIIPVVVDIPAERKAVGEYFNRDRGKLTLKAQPKGEEIKSLFLGAPVDVELVSDFKSAAWRKLALNSAGAVSALTLKPASIVNHPSAERIMRHLIAECVQIGIAEGAELDMSIVEQVIDRYRTDSPEGINSLHADRLAGRAMEVDARHGVIVRLGQRHGIATPVNALVAALLEAST
ncbi:2-dehydropantoate 2-reductase [Phyllobacterium sp. SB3]|uniref:2-dehydropantoate 2-reductase n=1 Tax=Phyllobacterium sp. SB3 TaxID=3156073 RepID=UPI0032AEB208